jgi:hypothetical protein
MSRIEIRTVMRAIRITMGCDCLVGRMEVTGIVIDTNPPLYSHACTKCGKTATLDSRHPRIEFEPDPDGHA